MRACRQVARRLPALADALEHRLRGRHAPALIDEQPPVFIIGVPRSGTTLVYELMVHFHELACFTNFGSHFFRTPRLGALLERRLAPKQHRPPPGLNSLYGYVPGEWSPHEGTAYWTRWFGDGDAGIRDTEEKIGTEGERLRAELADMTGIRGCRYVFKSLFNSMRIPELAAALPCSVFIDVRRDPVESMLSLYQWRRTRPTMTEWVSVVPPHPRLQAVRDPIDQIAGQVYFIRRLIDDSLNTVDPQRRLTLDYEAFCARPGEHLERIRDFARLPARGTAASVQARLEQIHARRKAPEDPELAAALATALKRWEDTAATGRA